MTTIDFSVIVPTYKECANLTPLTERLFMSLAEHNLAKNTELIIVDDNSNDGSVEAIENLRKQKFNVTILVRTKERGLSSAVLHGFNSSSPNTNLICMDADLQHPPEKVVELIDALKTSEFVIGTRYAGSNAIDKDWPVHRRIISGGARILARPLTPLSDPMTGFFGIQRKAYMRANRINPIGFKICLESYVKAGIKSHAEVPIVFGVRTAGESKLSSKVIIGYLQHLWELYMYKIPWFIPALLFTALVTLYSAFKL